MFGVPPNALPLVIYIGIFCYWVLLHCNMSFKTIANGFNGAFWWYGPLSEDRENFKHIYQNYLVALTQGAHKSFMICTNFWTLCLILLSLLLSLVLHDPFVCLHSSKLSPSYHMIPVLLSYLLLLLCLSYSRFLLAILYSSVFWMVCKWLCKWEKNQLKKLSALLDLMHEGCLVLVWVLH